MKRNWMISVLIIIVLIACTACGSNAGNNEGSSTVEGTDNSEPGVEEDTTTPDNYEELKIIEQGYSVGQDHYMNFGLVIENPNKDVAFEYPTIIITAYDENGEVLATSEETGNYIQPGDKQAFGSSFDCNGKKPSKVEFSVESGTAIAPSDTAVKSSDLKATGVNDRKNDDEVTVTGKIMNMSQNDTEDVKVVVLFKNDDKIVYGDYTFPSGGIKAGSEKPFELSEYDLPSYNTIEVYAVDWGN